MCVGAPGSTKVQVLCEGHEDGPAVPVQVDVWPVHVTEAGQVVSVMTVVEIIVEFG